MPLVLDFALRRLSDLAATSPSSRGEFPDTYHEFRRVLDQADREPLLVRIQGERTKHAVERVGAFLLQFAIKDMLPNGRKAGRIPALVYSLAHRDPSLLTDMVQNLYNSLDSGFTAMQFAVLCTDGWSSGRRAVAQDQASRSVFGDAPFVHLDSRLYRGVVPANSRRDSLLPFWSSVPTLLVSGTLDSNTPGFQAEEVLWGLAHGSFLRVENGFHETLPSPEVQAVVAEFLGGADVRNQAVRFPPPEFLTIEEAKAAPPATH